MRDKIYRAAVIGCGRVAWMFEDDPLIPDKPCTHAGAYQKAENVVIIAGADQRPDRLHEFVKKFGVDNVYLDYREMLAKEVPDIVSICAYAPDRFEMVVDSINAGVKGIWCEKAFATSLLEADEMVRLCRENGVNLIISYLRRWNSDYNLARKIILDESIGDPVSAVCHFSGNMIHTGTHAFDVLRMFFGDAAWVEGDLEYNRQTKHHEAFGSTEDLILNDTGGYAMIRFNNGVYATVHGDSKGFFIFEFDIMCTGGRIKIGNHLFEVSLAENSKTESGLIELYKKDISCDNAVNAFVAAVQNLTDSLDGGENVICGPEDGKAALEIALAINQSHSLSGKRVELPLKDRHIKVLSR